MKDPLHQAFLQIRFQAFVSIEGRLTSENQSNSTFSDVLLAMSQWLEKTSSDSSE